MVLFNHKLISNTIFQYIMHISRFVRKGYLRKWSVFLFRIVSVSYCFCSTVSLIPSVWDAETESVNATWIDAIYFESTFNQHTFCYFDVCSIICHLKWHQNQHRCRHNVNLLDRDDQCDLVILFITHLNLPINIYSRCS